MKRVLWFLCSLAFAFGAVASAQALESEPLVTPHVRVTLASDVEHGRSCKILPTRSAFQADQRLAYLLGQSWRGRRTTRTRPELAARCQSLRDCMAGADSPEGRSGDDLFLPRRGPLPVVVTNSEQLPSFHVTAKAHWLVCANICVPEQGTFHLDLPIGKATPSAAAPLFTAAAARVPQPSPFDARVLPNATLSVHGKDSRPSPFMTLGSCRRRWGEIDDLAPQNSQSSMAS